jgi:hypothetical protein
MAKGTSYLWFWCQDLAQIEHKLERRHTTLHHVMKSIYVFQLRAWFEFAPPERFWVRRMEDFFLDPVEGMRDICSFLGESLLTGPSQLGFTDLQGLPSLLNVRLRDSAAYDLQRFPLLRSIPAAREDLEQLRQRFLAYQDEPYGLFEPPAVSALGRCSRRRIRAQKNR